MASHTAQCACGRVEITVEGEPGHVYVCHCAFCQRMTGGVFIARASFNDEQVASISGQTRCYNGLEVDGVGAVGIPGGINYRFCEVCGSHVYFDMIYPATGTRFFTIPLGAFVEPVFSSPSTEYSTKHRHPWVQPIADAAQLPDPLGADAEAAWRETDAGRQAGSASNG
jgi:hypothetical protein